MQVFTSGMRHFEQILERIADEPFTERTESAPVLSPLLRRCPADRCGLFLAGDDVSWTAGRAEGVVQTALNAVRGVMRHRGGATDPANPGPGDVHDRIAPVGPPED